MTDETITSTGVPTAPLVSICIPTYNRASMVGDAIRSALSQSYPNIEVIVVDNASTDATDDVVASFHDKRLRYVRNPKNLGLFGNFNRCIDLSSGEFVHILHSDDTMSPAFTETGVNFFQSHPEVVLTFTSLQIITENKNVFFSSYSDTDKIFPPPEAFRRLLEERSFIPCPSVMVRRSVYDAVGTYPLEYSYSSDYWMWLTISRNYSIAFIKEPYISYHQGEHSESFRFLFASPLGYLDLLRIYIRLVHELADERKKFGSELNAALNRYMKDCMFAGIVRSENLKYFSPLVVGALALNAWSLIIPQRFTDHVRHWLMLPVIFAVLIVMSVPLFRKILKKSIFRNKSLYY